MPIEKADPCCACRPCPSPPPLRRPPPLPLGQSESPWKRRRRRRPHWVGGRRTRKAGGGRVRSWRTKSSFLEKKKKRNGMVNGGPQSWLAMKKAPLFFLENIKNGIFQLQENKKIKNKIKPEKESFKQKKSLLRGGGGGVGLEERVFCRECGT